MILCVGNQYPISVNHKMAGGSPKIGERSPSGARSPISCPELAEGSGILSLFVKY
jgi:hypothetical protein